MNRPAALGHGWGLKAVLGFVVGRRGRNGLAALAALLVLTSIGPRVAWAEEFSVTVTAIIGEPVPELPATVDEDTTIPLTATVQDPPTEQWVYSPTSLDGPEWEWICEFGYNSSEPDNFTTADPESYAYSFFQEDAGAPEAEVTFKPLVEGYFELTASALVSYYDSVGDNTWLGVGVGVLLLPAAPAGGYPFKLESNPNNALAVGPDWKAQANPVEVIKGWKVRYTAPVPAGTTVEWFADGPEPDGNDDFTNFDDGNPLVETENNVGLYMIKYKATDSMGNVTWSATRPLVITDISVPGETDGFNLVAGGQYTKDGFIVKTPATDAITISGQVNQPAGSPTVKKIKWGFVQRVLATHTVKWEYDNHVFDANSPAGTTLTFPAYFKPRNVPASILVNDAPQGKQLFGGHTPIALGAGEASIGDTPSILPGLNRMPWGASDGRRGEITYEIKQNHVSHYEFTTWLVVGHFITNQWVPLRQRGWTLDWNTTEPRTVKAIPTRLREVRHPERKSSTGRGGT